MTSGFLQACSSGCQVNTALTLAGWGSISQAVFPAAGLVVSAAGNRSPKVMGVADTERVAAQLRALRKAAGTITGHASEAGGEGARDILTDVLSVFGSDVGLHWVISRWARLAVPGPLALPALLAVAAAVAVVAAYRIRRGG
jgi:hypothetical protein